MINKKYSILLIGLLVMSKLFSQQTELSKSNLFDKLNFDAQNMKQVKKFYENGKEKKVLNSLFEVYKNKENIYYHITKNDIPFINENYSEDVKRSIEIADQVIDKYFLFREDWDMEKTNIPYQFKNDINWQINPFGDPEWTWMLNRHKYWTHLGIAYFITGNEKYAKTFIAQVTHWIDNNPLTSLNDDHRNSGVWRTIEAGVRIENWIKAFELIKTSKYITPNFLEKFLNSLHQHGEYISNIFSNFSLTSNWGVLENHGLFNLAIFLKEFKTAPQWLNKAIVRLETCIRLQVLDDGTHWEHSPMYHNEVFHSFLNVNLLAQRKDIELPDTIVEKTKAMSYANVQWQKPNYHQPLLGDSDDTDLRSILSMASYIFKDSVLKSRALKNLDFENYLVLGDSISKSYEKIPETRPPFLSVFQKSSGDFYMRTSWEEDAIYSSLHLKKLAAGHAHDDLLSFTIYANNRDYLVDNGRFNYVDNSWRKLLKSNISHNTIGVDDLPNSILEGSWGSEYEAWSNDIYTKSTALFDYGEASNTAYKRLEDPVDMKRSMLFLKPNIWLIFDSFYAKGQHKYSQYFNFPNKKVQIKDDAISTTYIKQNLLIKPLKDVELALMDSWYSPEYNLKKKSKRVEVFKNAEGFTSFISLLYFPEITSLNYKKTPVYDRNNILLSDTDAEALTILFEDKEYTLLVVYNSSTIANHFFVVDGTMVHGEVVLLEKEERDIKIHIIKN